MKSCCMPIIFVFLLLSACIPTTEPTTTITITKPDNGDKVQRCVRTEGTWQHIPDEHEIWLLIQPSETDYVYPQNKASVSANNKWSCRVCMGAENEVGMKFGIIVVLADMHAHEEFQKYKDEGDKTDDWPGLPELPDGASEYDCITVVRGEE